MHIIMRESTVAASNICLLAPRPHQREPLCIAWSCRIALLVGVLQFTLWFGFVVESGRCSQVASVL